MQAPGAACCCSPRRRSWELRTPAEAVPSGTDIIVHLDDEPMAAAQLPQTVLHHVLHTRESVILDDAATQPAFATDPYISGRRARSILCVPLANQTRLIGALYLETNPIPRAF